MSNKNDTVFLNQIFDEALGFIVDLVDAIENQPAVQKNCLTSSPISNNYCSTIGATTAANCSLTTTTTSASVTSGNYNTRLNIPYNPPLYSQPIIYGPIIQQPIIWVDALRDFTPSCSKDTSYPVTNFSCDKDGNVLIEIACTGFELDELTVERKDLKIIVEGKRKNKEAAEDRKYFYRNIATRDFTREFMGSEKWCFDKLSVSYKDGLLAIAIPLKEEFQPVRQKYEIK